MSIVMMPMISNSPRCVTLGNPGYRSQGGEWLLPMILCESEPGNNSFFKINLIRIKNTSSQLQITMVNYWLAKQEPKSYNFATLKKEVKTVWDGVHNNLALKHISNMKKGDLILPFRR